MRPNPVIVINASTTPTEEEQNCNPGMITNNSASVGCECVGAQASSTSSWCSK